METPLVSWLMPVYNCEKSIQYALDSIVNQNYQNYEIVVVEDGSSDSTLEICEDFKKRNNRMILIKNEGNLGVAKSLNRGLEYCHGKYVARMDADDYSLPDRLNIQVSYMEKHPETFLIGGNAKIINEETGETSLQYQSDISAEEVKIKLLFSTCFCHPTILFRNTADMRYPERITEDYALFASLISKRKMEIIKEIVLEYHVNCNSISRLAFKHLRSDSENISREAIFNVLKIDTTRFHSSIFGWRIYDAMPEDPKCFLQNAHDLYMEMLNQNNYLHTFDKNILHTQLQNEWNASLKLIAPYFFPDLYGDFERITKQKIEEDFDGILSKNATRWIMYGAGNFCKTWLSLASAQELEQIICFCDADKNKQGTILYGKKIISPEELEDLNFDKIVVSAVSVFNEIVNELKSIGIEEGKIEVLKAPSGVYNFQREYKMKLQNVKNYKSRKKIYMFCAADYGNLGDHAIAEAEHQFLKEQYNLELCEIPFLTERCYLSTIDNMITEKDIIAITGGGFLGSLWETGELRVHQILTRYPKNRVIIFPQTMYWEKEGGKLFEHSLKVFNNHEGGVVLCARDKTSYKKMRQLYRKCEVLLVPDMVLSVKWKEYYCNQVRNGIALCLRNDKESVLNNDEKKNIERILEEYSRDVYKISMDSDRKIYESERCNELENILKRFSKLKLVVTDRLHGMIFSYITRTPCVVLPNCSHKLLDNYGWLEDVPFVRFINSIENMREHINIVFNMNEKQKGEKDFSKEFARLINLKYLK